MEENKCRKTEKKNSGKMKNTFCPDVEKVLSGQNALAVRMHGEKISDVLGSYTGSPKYDDEPVQDADDLK